MTKAEWLSRARQHFIEKTRATDRQGKTWAQIIFDNLLEYGEDIESIEPEEAVDEELSYWTD